MELYERELLPELVKWLDRREILAIKGPRQSEIKAALRHVKKRKIRDHRFIIA